MKDIESIKNGMILYLRSDIENLSEQTENSEIMGFWNRTQSVLGAMMLQKLLDETELQGLHGEVASALETARKNEI